jgi:hypothetical protein
MWRRHRRQRRSQSRPRARIQGSPTWFRHALVDLDKAVIQVDAGHGDIALLDAAAPGLVSAAEAVRTTARSNLPCSSNLLRAEKKVVAATSDLSRASHELAQLTATAKAGKDYSASRAASWRATTQEQTLFRSLSRRFGPPGSHRW